MRPATLSGLSIVFVLLWSSGWIVSSFAISEISAISILTTRYLIVFACLSAYLLITDTWRHIAKCHIPAHLFVGVLSHAAYLLAGVGAFELGVTAALVAFITALQPLLTAVFSMFITAERASLRQWTGLLIGLLAVTLLVSDSYQHGVSIYALLLPFIAVVSLSIGSLIYCRVELNEQQSVQGSNQGSIQGSGPLAAKLFLHATGALSLLIPMSIMHGELHFDYSAAEWSVVLWLALVVSLGAYAVLAVLLRNSSAMRVSSLTYLVPPVTMLQAHLFLGESIGFIGIASMLVACIGVYLVMTERSISPDRKVFNRSALDIEL